MRHRQSGRHLGRDSAHRRSLYRNLVTDLLRYERITTTEAKAKEIRPIAEKIITLGKRGDLHARRQALKFVFDKHVVDHVFEDIAPRMAGRPGGYLRITALEPRKGDGALMTAIELVDYAEAGDGAYVPPAATTTTAAAAPAAASATAVAPPPAETAEPEADTAEEVAEEPVADAPEAQAEEPATATADEADEVVAEADTVEAPTAEAEEPAEAPAEDDVEEDEKDGGT